MRRSLSIVKATALEVLSEPLTLLLLLAGLTIAVLSPAFHYHQFGEASRMARDAGVSSLFLGGTAFAVFATIRAFRREIESGTLEMALAHPVSRGGFFLAKVLGCLVAYLLFALVLAAVTLVMVNGAEIGGLIAARTGDIARVWGPSLAIGVAVILVPLVVAAALNRFARFRFVISSFLLAALLAVAGVAFYPNGRLILRLLPAMALVMVPSVILLTAAAAAAVRFKVNAAASVAGVVLALMLPFIGNYYLPDALAKGGCLPWSYVLMGFAVALSAMIAFLLLGSIWMNAVER